MKYKVFLDDIFLFEMTCKNISNIESILPRIIKKKVNFEEIEQLIFAKYDYEKYGVCSFCEELYYRIPTYKCKIEGMNIYIINVELSKYLLSQSNGYENFELKKCHNNKLCPSVKLNKNSIDYIKTIYGLDTEKSRNFIHERNKSPFYKLNHKDEFTYKKYQSSRLFYEGIDEVEKNKIISLQNYKRSLEYYKLKYGEDEGEVKWKNIGKRKAITLENMISKYGEDEGLKRYKSWLKRCSLSLENMISKYGEDEGNLRWNNYLNKLPYNTYGHISYTKNGNILRSNLEKDFYECLLKSGIKSEEIIHEKLYNDEYLFRSDFYLINYDCHIEIVGLMKDEKYRNKIELKKKLFNPYIVTPKDNFKCIIENIKNERGKNEN